jgi:hypothetical protein
MVTRGDVKSSSLKSSSLSIYSYIQFFLNFLYIRIYRQGETFQGETNDVSHTSLYVTLILSRLTSTNNTTTRAHICLEDLEEEWAECEDSEAECPPTPSLPVQL